MCGAPSISTRARRSTKRRRRRSFVRPWPSTRPRPKPRLKANPPRPRLEALAAASGRRRQRPWAHDIFPHDLVVGIDLDQRDVIGPEIGEMLEHPLGVGLVELRAL